MSRLIPPGLSAWRFSPAGGYRTLGMIVIAVGLLIGRPDVAVLGIPMFASLLWALVDPPAAGPRVGRGAIEMVGTRVSQVLTVEPAPNVEGLRLRVSSPGFRGAEVAVDMTGRRDLTITLQTAHTGRAELFLLDHMAFGPDFIFHDGPHRSGPVPAVLLPSPVRLGELPIPSHLQGMTGSHGSRRIGEGGDLRDVALFAPGDRLRRIDWKATARRGSTREGGHRIYVRRTHATADAHVMLVVDPYDIVGPDVATWSSGRVRPDHRSSLDIARGAAVSLARHYLDQGDRVGLVDLGRQRRLLLPAAGRRHLHRLTHHIALSEAGPEMVPHHRAPQIPSGSLVVLFSTFLDDDTARLATMWRHNGHRVIAVDVLPRLVSSRLSPEASLAFRMVMMERSDRLDLLRMADVETVRWLGGDLASAPDAPVATLTAMARTRRRHRR